MASASAMETFLRSQTPRWLSQLLKITFDDTIPLEDLFANCWVLGRVADIARSLLRGVLYHAPSKQLGDRPYRAIMSDMENFSEICTTLCIPQDTRISLTDVEQRRAGPRIAMCLWAISDALREKGFTREIPDFAPKHDSTMLRRGKPGDAHASRMLPFQMYNGHTSAAAPQHYNTGKPDSDWHPSDAHSHYHTAENNESLSAETAPPIHGFFDIAMDQRGSESAVSDPVTLHQRLPTDHHRDAPAVKPKFPEAVNGSAGEFGIDDPGFDVVTSILSPEKLKPSHARVLSAIMRTDGDALASGDDVGSGLGASAKRSLELAIDGSQCDSGDAGNSAATNISPTKGRSNQRNSVRYVHIVTRSKGRAGQHHDGPDLSERRPWWRSQLAITTGAAVSAVAAVGIILAAHGSQGEKSQRKRTAVIHQGRW